MHSNELKTRNVVVGFGFDEFAEPASSIRFRSLEYGIITVRLISNWSSKSLSLFVLVVQFFYFLHTFCSLAFPIFFFVFWHKKSPRICKWMHCNHTNRNLYWENCHCFSCPPKNPCVLSANAILLNLKHSRLIDIFFDAIFSVLLLCSHERAHRSIYVRIWIKYTKYLSGVWVCNVQACV